MINDELPIVIGSHAAGCRGVKPERLSKDADIICSYNLFKEIISLDKYEKIYPASRGKKYIAIGRTDIIEAELTWEGSSAAMLAELIRSDPNTIVHRGWIIPSIDVLLMLKESHKYLKNSPHFLKTMNDIIALRKAGAKFDPRYAEWYEIREKETYDYSHPDLTVDKDNFFNKNESFYVYDHDTIHEAIKFSDVPMYTKFIADGEQVKCSKDKFDKLTETEKMMAVLEESYVLALERSLIPSDFKSTEKFAFETALMKVCTSITSGWFREYAWENYYHVVGLHESLKHDFVGLFKKALADGKILPFNKD